MRWLPCKKRQESEGSKMLNATRPKNKTIFLYLLIPVAMFVFTVFVPLVTALVYSFYEWKGGPNKTFTGLANYIKLFHDTTFWEAFGHNIYLVVACIIGQVGIAFILVMMVNSKLVKFKTIHRTFGFFPSTISAVCIGMIWTMVYHNKYGILNWFLKAIGRDDLTQVWLNNTKLVMLLVTIPLIWQFIGYYMVIILSAISGISTDIFESASIDGANGVQQALHITLPLIKNTMLVCITLCIAGNMKAFDSIYVMTSGGPGTSSMVMAMYGYQVSFGQSNMGYGSCISVGIFVLSLIVIGGSQALINRATKGKGED
ncbi:MAG: sugar ABC transporter permease [Clostridiales bacterium]|nr:sugar ABC transporter permease [Clostridiales bacterium]